mgnify:CR=1 FL=1
MASREVTKYVISLTDLKISKLRTRGRRVSQGLVLGVRQWSDSQKGIQGPSVVNQE